MTFYHDDDAINRVRRELTAEFANERFHHAPYEPRSPDEVAGSREYKWDCRIARLICQHIHLGSTADDLKTAVRGCIRRDYL